MDENQASISVFRREFPDDSFCAARVVGKLFARSFIIRAQPITAAAQGSPGDLLAQKLQAEFSQADDVRDGVCIPAFRKHGDGDDAAHMLTERTALADSVNDFAENFRVRNILSRACAPDARILAFEEFDFRSKDFAEVLVHLSGIFQRIAVYEQSRRLGTRLPRDGIVV